jgi:hypothetical protein
MVSRTKKQSLLETNPYLSDPVKRKKMLLKSVLSSSAIEGIKIAEERLKEMIEKDQDKPV